MVHGKKVKAGLQWVNWGLCQVGVGGELRQKQMVIEGKVLVQVLVGNKETNLEIVGVEKAFRFPEIACLCQS